MLKLMYFQALSISLLIHSVITLSILALEKPQNDSSKDKNIVEIEYIDMKGPQIVAEALAPNLDLTNNSQTKYQSNSHQRVEKQQLASKTGKTKNRSRFEKLDPKLLPPLDGKNEGSASISDLSQDSSNLSLSKKDQIKDQVKQEEVYENFFKDRGISSIQDRVFEDLKYGHFTALNTDRNQFYSFYERIHDQIRIRWNENIEREMNNIRIKNPEHVFKSKEWISQLEVVVNLNGDIVSSFITKGSGKEHWDDAALSALSKAAPFINPPKAMADADGLIRLKYLFSLRL